MNGVENLMNWQDLNEGLEMNPFHGKDKILIIFKDKDFVAFPEFKR